MLTVCFTETDDYSRFHLSTPIFPEEKGDRSLLTQVPALETISADCQTFVLLNLEHIMVISPKHSIRLME